MSRKGGILADLARKVELNRQKAIDSPLLRARWRKLSDKKTLPGLGSPKLRVKSFLPGIEENQGSKFYLTRANSECGLLGEHSSEEQQALETIFQAIRNNKPKKVKSVIKESKVNLNTLNLCGFGPLHEACYLGNLKCIKILVENGADVNYADSERWTPLFAAVCGEHFDCIRFLVGNNAVINCYDSFGVSPLRIAVNVKNLDIINYLVKRGADIMSPAFDGKSPFQIVVELADDAILTYFLHLPSLHVRNGKHY